MHFTVRSDTKCTELAPQASLQVELTVKEKVALVWLLVIRKEPAAGVREPFTSPGWASLGGSPVIQDTTTSPRVPTLATENSTLRADIPMKEGRSVTFNSEVKQ